MMPLYQTSSRDLFADAFFILHRRLMFASLYGRDANVLSLLASLNTGDEAVGFRLPEDKQHHPPNTTACLFTELHKRMTKIHTHNYGVLTHVFVYAGDLVEYNRDTRSGWVVLDNTEADMLQPVWRCVMQLADVPLLDEWAPFVVHQLQQHGHLTFYRPGIAAEAAIVGVQACHICLPSDFDALVSQWLKSGALQAA